MDDNALRRNLHNCGEFGPNVQYQEYHVREKSNEKQDNNNTRENKLLHREKKW